MVPMVLVGTVLTHLFGGSAGREGTAVQMGASLADYLSHRAEARQRAAAPAARRRRRRRASAPCSARRSRARCSASSSSCSAGSSTTRSCRRWSRRSSATSRRAASASSTPRYPSPPHVELTPLLCAQVARLRASRSRSRAIAFIELTHFLKRRGERHVPMLGLRMAIGGAIVVRAVAARRHERLPRPRRADDRALVHRSEAAGLRVRAEARVHGDHARRRLPRRRGHAAVLRRRHARGRARTRCSASRASSARASGSRRCSPPPRTRRSRCRSWPWSCSARTCCRTS